MPAIAWEALPLLGMYRFGSAAATSSVITIPAVELLQIQFNIEGYGSGGGIAAFRFNADSTAANYASEYITWSTAAPTVVNALATFAGFKTGANSVTVQRSGLMTIKNNSSTSHLITCQSLTHAAASAASVQSTGGGKYVTGGAAQITSVQMLVDTGVTLSAGTSFAIFGMTPA